VTPGGGEFRWELVVPRVVHPTKVTIIELLRERSPLTATEMYTVMKDEIEVTVGQVHYHAATLLKGGVLKLARGNPRGAATEKFYELAPQE